MKPKRILLVGAGHVGLYVALRLARKLSSRRAEIVVVDPQPHMTYQPFLPEAAAGSIEPRHCVAPLRRVLRGVEVLSGRVTKIEHARRTATVQPITGPDRELRYDEIVVAPGSVSRTLPIPGLKEYAVGFKTIGEAIWLRNHVLSRLDIAATTTDPDTRARALTFVLVGGGYAGIEAIAELEDMARDAIRYYPELAADHREVGPNGSGARKARPGPKGGSDRNDRGEARRARGREGHMRWVLVEATRRILPEVDPDMGAYTVRELLERGFDIRLETRLESCVDGHVVLSDGEEFDADTVVWTAGVKPHPMLADTDMPRDRKGRVTCLPTLQVVGPDGEVVDGAWSAGDCAAVPDLTATPKAGEPKGSGGEPEGSGGGPKGEGGGKGALCSPSAQHAVRQAHRLADNIRAKLLGRQIVAYRHKHAGSVASLGLHRGVAQVYGVKLRGFPAWFMHRTYHLTRVPSFNRKVRVVLDWTLALFLKREVVSMGQLHDPREPFTEYAVGADAADEAPR